MVGGVLQVFGYRDTFLRRDRGTCAARTETFQAYNPRCYVIVGRVVIA